AGRFSTSRINHDPASHCDNGPEERNPPPCGTTAKRTLRIALHSTSSGECLLTVIADCKLTSCTMDPAESRIFLGTSKGAVAQINLYMEPVLRERHLTTVGDNDEMPLFRNHKAAVTSLSTNLDGSMFVSGDALGQYCIWDVASRQCLKSATMKGTISTAQFIPNWLSLGEAEYKKSPLPVAVLQKQLAKSLEPTVPVVLRPAVGMSEMNNQLDEMIARRLRGEEISTTTWNDRVEDVQRKRPKAADEEEESDNDEDDEVVPETVEGLKAALNKARRANRQLYSFAVSQIVDNKS
uniref:Uncharacterized protein n=1 Tax=Plectus sambesii TaxID=2011161 RepID=A0A914XLI1_9BILA